MLSKDERNRLKDYFEPWELVQLLDVSMDEILDVLEGHIEEAIDELNEITEFDDED